jgi:hypothetical protein
MDQTAKKRVGLIAAIFGGGVLMTALAIAVTIGLGILAFLGMKALVVLVATSIGHAIAQVFKDLAHSFKL